MERSGIMETFLSAPYRSACRAACLVVVTLFVASKIPQWIQSSLRISPLLAILMVLVVIYILGQLWKKYSSDVNVTFFRLLIYGIQIVSTLKIEYFNTTNQQVNQERQQLKRKFIRVLVLFLMAQHCIVPNVSIVWLHTLLAYKFITDILHLAYFHISRQEYRDNNGNAFPADVNQRILNKLTYWAIIIFKIGYSTSVVYYTCSNVSFAYIIVTGSYFMLSQHYLENRITKFLESFHFDFFEGLEVFYVNGLFGCVEVLYAIVFMIWSLMKEKQMLMFISLYTNIYQGGKEIMNYTMTTAFNEWTNLAQFERATKEELSGHDDVCAICLCVMKSARKTPCKHFFHGHCLRRCLKEKNLCPMCNKSLDKS